MLGAAIESDGEVVLAGDVGGALHPDLLDGVASDVHAENLCCSGVSFVGRLCELDASRLATAAGEYLRLDDDRAAKLVRRRPRLVGSGRKPPLGDGDSEALEELLPLEFVQVQSAGESTRWSSTRRQSAVCASMAR